MLPVPGEPNVVRALVAAVLRRIDAAGDPVATVTHHGVGAVLAELGFADEPGTGLVRRPAPSTKRSGRDGHRVEAQSSDAAFSGLLGTGWDAHAQGCHLRE